jgi:TetR/AcrR family transcriptional regulator
LFHFHDNQVAPVAGSRPGNARRSGAPAAPRRQARGERTRAAILRAAELHFGAKGYTDTRLEDIAEAIGIQQPGIFYHFEDKRGLYETVLEEALGELVEGVRGALEAAGSAADRLERAVETWVDAVAARPTLARFILREAASPDLGSTARAVRESGREIVDLIRGVLEDGMKAGEFAVEDTEILHFESAMAGTSIFFVSAMARLVPEVAGASERPEAIAIHKRLMLRTVRVLLGVRDRTRSGGVSRRVRRA